MLYDDGRPLSAFCSPENTFPLLNWLVWVVFELADGASLVESVFALVALTSGVSETPWPPVR